METTGTHGLASSDWEGGMFQSCPLFVPEPVLLTDWGLYTRCYALSAQPGLSQPGGPRSHSERLPSSSRSLLGLIKSITTPYFIARCWVKLTF